MYHTHFCRAGTFRTRDLPGRGALPICTGEALPSGLECSTEDKRSLFGIRALGVAVGVAFAKRIVRHGRSARPTLRERQAQLPSATSGKYILRVLLVRCRSGKTRGARAAEPSIYGLPCALLGTNAIAYLRCNVRQGNTRVPTAVYQKSLGSSARSRVGESFSSTGAMTSLRSRYA